MILLNFSHPITAGQVAQVEALAQRKIESSIVIPCQFTQSQPFAEQIRALVDSIEFSAEDWQTIPLLINPPAYNYAALTLLAELHGRMGYFPAIIRIRPIADSIPPAYEVAEIINLQAVREQAREQR